MSAAASVLKWLWPFLKEMVLGDKTVGQALRTNKARVLLLILILGSLGMNMLMTPRLVTISAQYIELQKTHKKLVGANKDIDELQTRYDELKKKFEDDKKDLNTKDAKLDELHKRNRFLTDKVIEYIDGVPYCKTPIAQSAPAGKGRYDTLRNTLDKMREAEQ